MLADVLIMKREPMHARGETGICKEGRRAREVQSAKGAPTAWQKLQDGPQQRRQKCPVGLCIAAHSWARQQGADEAQRVDSVAFQALTPAMLNAAPCSTLSLD